MQDGKKTEIVGENALWCNDIWRKRKKIHIAKIFCFFNLGWGIDDFMKRW